MEDIVIARRSARKRTKELNHWQKIFNVLIGIYTVFFVAEKCLPGYFFSDWMVKIEIIVGVIMIAMLILKLIMVDGNQRKKWFAASALTFVYFIIRFITLAKLGFEPTTVRTIFFEVIYLLCLSEFTMDTKFFKSFVMKFTMIWTFALNIPNIIFYKMLIASGRGSSLEDFFVEYSFLKHDPYRPKGTLFINPNTFGILSALCIIFAYILYCDSKSKYRKPIFIACILFYGTFLIISGCRSGMLAVLIVFAIALLNKVFPKLSCKKEILAIYLIILIATGGMVVFIHSNEADNIYDFTYKEMDIDAASSGRYFIWKSAFHSDKDNLVLGCGSLRNELNLRNDYQQKEHDIRAEWKRARGIEDVKPYERTILGPHNGYMAMILCTGYIGAIAFFILLFNKIAKSKALDNGNWYMLVIFFLITNVFENFLVVNKYFICLFMFMVLGLDEEIPKKKLGHKYIKTREYILHSKEYDLYGKASGLNN